MNKLDRNAITVKHPGDLDDDGYVKADHATLISMVWDITADVWAFIGQEDAQRRLQRHVTNLIRRER